MHPTTVNSHRAFMVITTTLAVCLAFSLTAGWHWYFKEIAVRKRLLEVEAQTTRQAKVPDAPPSRQELLPPTAPRLTSDASDSLSLANSIPQSSPANPGPNVPKRAEVAVVSDAQNAALLKDAERLILEYIATADWRDRLPFVWNLERVLPLMEDYYEYQGGKDPTLGALQSTGRFTVSGMEILHFSFNSNRTLGSLELALRRDADGEWRIDWESFVGYSEQTWTSLGKTRPTSPTLLRAFVKMGDYFNYEFSDSSRFVCVRLLAADGESLLHAYCERGTALADYLNAELGLGSGQTKGFTVRIAYPANAESENCVWITEVVSPRWLLSPEEM